ncbi:MAG TPA: YceD family protein [Pseudonocardiaceae bacterium]
MRRYERTVPAPAGLGVEGVIVVPEGDDVELDLRVESVVEGVLVTGSVTATVVGECSRCLDPLSEDVTVHVTELYAYPDSATDTSTDADEVSRVVDDLVDTEPTVRDALLLALPQAPLCTDDCAGLCPECGGKRAELGADHRHESIDARWAALAPRLGDIEEENE